MLARPRAPFGNLFYLYFPLDDLIPLICKHLYAGDAQIYNTSPDFFPVLMVKKNLCFIIYPSCQHQCVEETIDMEKAKAHCSGASVAWCDIKESLLFLL